MLLAISSSLYPSTPKISSATVSIRPELNWFCASSFLPPTLEELTIPERSAILSWTEAAGIFSLKELLAGEGIDMTGWSLEYAAEVSADGWTIVGWGINPEGDTEAWKITLDAAPVLLPSTLWLMGGGIIALAGIHSKGSGDSTGLY
jgi:hypothetical protein